MNLRRTHLIVVKMEPGKQLVLNENSYVQKSCLIFDNIKTILLEKNIKCDRGRLYNWATRGVVCWFWILFCFVKFILVIWRTDPLQQ